MTPNDLSTLLKKTDGLEQSPAVAALAAGNAKNFQVWLTNNDGYIVLNWNAPVVGNYDFIALYAPGGNENDPKGYITRQWQYASQGSPYTTGTYSGPGYIGVYWSWDVTQGTYVNVAESTPST